MAEESRWRPDNEGGDEGEEDEVDETVRIRIPHTPVHNLTG